MFHICFIVSTFSSHRFWVVLLLINHESPRLDHVANGHSASRGALNVVPKAGCCQEGSPWGLLFFGYLNSIYRDRDSDRDREARIILLWTTVSHHETMKLCHAASQFVYGHKGPCPHPRNYKPLVHCILSSIITRQKSTSIYLHSSSWPKYRKSEFKILSVKYWASTCN